MIPTKLRLKNFIGIRSGLGRDEIVIDFDHEDAQLVALVGPNGTGKSTILDNLHPYRLMPSRAGSYSPDSFSFYDNVYGTEAVKELEFHHGNQHYRAILLFKLGAKTKKTECYLQYLDTDGQWQAARGKDGTISDGKTANYDRCIESILGTPEMFFTSAFAAQNRRSLSSYTNGEIKGLLSELLGLDNIATLGKQAHEVAKLLRIRLDGMRDELTRIDGLESERASTEKALDDDKVTLGFTMQSRHAAKERITAATRNLAAAKAELGASAEIETRRKTITAQLNGVHMRVGGALRDIDNDVQQEKNRASTAANNLRRDIAVQNNQRASFDRQIETNRALLSRGGEIAAAAAQVLTLEADERNATGAIEKARAKATKYRLLRAERDTVAAKLKAAGEKGQSTKAICEGLKTRSGLIDAVPCKGTDLQPRCQLLADASKARADIPAMERALTTARQEYEGLQKRGQEIETALELMGDPEAELIAEETKKNGIGEKLRQASKIAAEATALKQAEQIIAHATAQVKAISETIEAKTAEANELETRAAQRIAELDARRAKTREDADTEIRAIEQELATLPPPADDSQVAAAEVALEEAEAEQVKIDQEYEQINVRIATHKERLRRIEHDLQNAPAIKARAGTVEAEIAHWTTLAKAMGNDGIIALSIDDAGPTLSGLANDLLLSCYGPRFSVSLKTQRETASGDLKEDFDIRVFDAERDDDKSVRDMSGGERIWINECLTRAIALYQSQASGQQYGCLFADESDGALDPERKQMFVSMKRKVLELGGYEREIFISHTPALWESADAVIDVSTFKGN